MINSNILPHRSLAEHDRCNRGRTRSPSAKQDSLEILCNALRKARLNVAQHNRVDMILRIDGDVRYEPFQLSRLFHEIMRAVLSLSPAIRIRKLGNAKCWITIHCAQP